MGKAEVGTLSPEESDTLAASWLRVSPAAWA